MSSEFLTQFDSLEKQFFDTIISRDPILATDLGIKGYDTELPEASIDHELADIRILKDFLKKFSKIESRGFPPSREIDLELAKDLTRLKLYWKEKIRLWESSPNVAQAIGDSISQILIRDYAPLKLRLRSIYKRILKVPRFIEQSKSKLRRPVKDFVEIELKGLARLPGFFNILKNIASKNLLKTPFYHLHRAIEVAQDALDCYENWLIIDILPICRAPNQAVGCRGGTSFGEEKFKMLLKLRGIEETPAQLLTFGETELAKLKDRLKTISKQIDKKASIDEIRRVIKSNHPERFDVLINYVKESIEKAKKFVVRSGFANIPQNEKLEVCETPYYLRHLIPFGAYFPPGKFDRKQEGFYFITPPDSDTTKLRAYSFASLTNMTIHEGYPGHHLQLTSANLNKSLIRTFADAVETIEGWAHYCEEEVKKMGYDNSPTSNFVYTSDLIWRAVRVIVDVKLSTGKMEPLEAVDFLIRETGMSQMDAESEVRRYQMTPTYQLSYLFGKEKIKELKRYVSSRMKNKFTDKFFHNTILAAGSLPIYLLKKEFDWKIAAGLAVGKK